MEEDEMKNDLSRGVIFFIMSKRRGDERGSRGDGSGSREDERGSREEWRGSREDGRVSRGDGRGQSEKKRNLFHLTK